MKENRHSNNLSFLYIHANICRRAADIDIYSCIIHTQWYVIRNVHQPVRKYSVHGHTCCISMALCNMNIYAIL